MAKEIAEEYTSSLADLTLNSKPLINMLTILADENSVHAEAIVEAVINHLEKVRSEFKLPVLYLIDSIVKNVGRAYITLFTQHIVNIFCSVFEKVDERVRAQMFKLRQTWSDVFPSKKMYTLDIRVQCIDPAWPITAPAPTPSIHVNPKFFNKPSTVATAAETTTTTTLTTPATPTITLPLDSTTLDMQTKLINKHKELLELKQKKLELELIQAKAKLEEQQKQLERQSQSVQLKSLLSKVEIPKGSPNSVILEEPKSITPKIPSLIVQPKATAAAVTATTTTTTTSITRIAPVNSEMLSMMTPLFRDPRLRQQAPGKHEIGIGFRSGIGSESRSHPIVTQLPTQNTSNNFNTVNLNEKKVKSKTNVTINIDCGDNDKTSVNKAGVQNSTLNRKDPRLISKKTSGSTVGNKNKSNNGRPISKERSPIKSKITTSSRKSTKSSTSPRSYKNSSSNSSSSLNSSSNHKVVLSSSSANDCSNSNSSINKKGTTKDSNSNKNINDSSSKSSSSNKYKKKVEHNSPKSDKSVNEPKRKSSSNKVDKNSRSRERLSNVDESSLVSSPPPTKSTYSLDRRGFISVKNFSKSRNHIRRNRTPSSSPEPFKDAGLRFGAPPEKQARLQPPIGAETFDDSKMLVSDTIIIDDKDEDLRAFVGPATVIKKRSSSESMDQSNKRSKIQSYNVPPTPPPPIISTSSADNMQNKFSKDNRSNLDAIRAKLANATKKSIINETRNSAEDVLQKIIISQADEQSIKNGNLSQALIQKVLTLFETQKLQEAQRRESEKDSVVNTLTPISDDELSVDFSHSDSEDDKQIRRSDIFGENNRVPPPAPVISQTDSSKEQNKMYNDSRMPHNARMHQNWHPHCARRRRPKTHWDSPPPEPWLRPPAILNQSIFPPRRPLFQFPRGVDNFVPRMDMPMRPLIPPPTVPPHVFDSRRSMSPQTTDPPIKKDIPVVDHGLLDYVENDSMRTINIDGRPREIRYYDETAVVIMSWDDPREISFQNGSRVITVDDKDSYTLEFNDAYSEITIGGVLHRIRLGAPTKELFIDGKGYECFFGGSGLGIEVDGKMHIIKIEGPAPHVKIGNVKRTDLVAGKINLIINARTMVPVYLDAKPQKFDIEGKTHTLRFVDALRTVLINEVPFKVEFGGLPKPITVYDKKHFIRFSMLPRGIKPGYVNIANMEGTRLPSPPLNEQEHVDEIVNTNEPALPMLGKRRVRLTDHDNSPDRMSPVMQNSSLDVLSSIITSNAINSTNVSGYQIDSNQDSQDSFPSVNKSSEIPGVSDNTSSTSMPFLPTNININELFQKLVSTGIVSVSKEKSPSPVPVKVKEDEFDIKSISFTAPETLKIRQPSVIQALYSGMQCSSCGVRFPPEHSLQYSQHLDWHFRQNRRGKNSTRKAISRKWFYNVSDWKNFEEIEDLEEREKSWFESQQQQLEATGEDGDEDVEVPSVPTENNSQDDCCEVCHDKFEQFYNEEKEEWHLKMAVRIDGKTYHPLCYEDYKASLNNSTIDELANVSNETENIPDHKEDNSEIKEEIVEIKSESNEADAIKKSEEDDDDDVLIQEPKIESIVIDEDDLKVDSTSDIKVENDIFIPGNIVIKQEPIDEDDIIISDAKLHDDQDDHTMLEVNQEISTDTTRAELVSSIDGNVQCTAPTINPASVISGKIKINITKPIVAPKEPPSSTFPASESNSFTEKHSSDEPLPPGEEPVQLNLKPALQGLTLSKQPSVCKGSELTGLCSIM